MRVYSVASKNEPINWSHCLNECCPWYFKLRTLPWFLCAHSISCKCAQTCTHLNLPNRCPHAYVSLSTFDMHTSTQHKAYTFDIHLDVTKWHCRPCTRTDTRSQIQCTNSKAQIQASSSAGASESLVNFNRAATQWHWLSKYAVLFVALSKWQIWTARYSLCYTYFMWLKRKEMDGRKKRAFESLKYEI